MAIGNPVTLTSNVASKTISITATAGQTAFTVTGGYRINQLSVYRNGVRLVDASDYTARDGASVTLLSPASGGDTLEFQVFDDFRVADALNVNSGGTVYGNVNVVGIVSATSFSGIAAGYWEKTDVGINTSSSVGIGTTNPRTKLEIAGNTTNVNGYSDGQVQIVGNNPIAFVSQSNLSPGLNRWGFQVRAAEVDGNFSIYDFNNSRHSLLINSSGNIGINTTSPTGKLDVGGNILPAADNAHDLGSASKRWANIYSADIQMSNEGSVNEVDGTWGKYTIQEGENDLFLINRRNGKKYKFMLQEVD